MVASMAIMKFAAITEARTSVRCVVRAVMGDSIREQPPAANHDKGIAQRTFKAGFRRPPPHQAIESRLAVARQIVIEGVIRLRSNRAKTLRKA